MTQAQSKRAARQWLRVLSWNVAWMACGLVLLELVFGDWIFGSGYPFYVIRDRTLRYDCSALYEGCGTVDYSRDRWGLRGDHSTPAEIDVLTVGGSTTNQNFVAGDSTWQAVMSREVSRSRGARVVVANAGVEGQSSFGHIHALEHWFPKVPGLRPKVVIFFVGINDVPDDSEAGENEFDHEAETTLDWVDAAKERSALVSLARRIRGLYWSYRGGYPAFGHQRETFEDFVPFPELGDKARLYAQANQPRLEAYRRRLVKIAALTRSLWGAQPVFMTQAAAFVREGPPARVSARARDEAVALAAINNVTRGACASQNILCADLAREVHFDPADFYDNVHNTPTGTRKIGHFLAGKLPPGVFGP